MQSTRLNAKSKNAKSNKTGLWFTTTPFFMRGKSEEQRGVIIKRVTKFVILREFTTEGSLWQQAGQIEILRFIQEDGVFCYFGRIEARREISFTLK